MFKEPKISVPRKLLSPTKSGSQVNIYALDAYTIGISIKSAWDWHEIALYVDFGKAFIDGDNLDIRLTEPFLRFYALRDPDTKIVTGVNGGRILITVTRR